MDKLTWRITGNGTITVRYSTYWDEPGPFATQLNSEHAFINPAMILMYVPDRRAENEEIAMPDVPSGVASSGRIPSYSGVDGACARIYFAATSYDALIDAPIELGKIDQFDLPGMTPPVSVVCMGTNGRRKKLRKSCGEFARMS